MKAFITITGLKFHFGSKPFEVGQKVKLVKEPDNEYDSEPLTLVSLSGTPFSMMLYLFTL